MMMIKGKCYIVKALDALIILFVMASFSHRLMTGMLVNPTQIKSRTEDPTAIHVGKKIEMNQRARKIFFAQIKSGVRKKGARGLVFL